MPHKRYIVFEYDSYYPLGGMSDVGDSYDTKEEAIDVAQKSRYDHTEVYDRIEGVEVEYKRT